MPEFAVAALLSIDAHWMRAERERLEPPPGPRDPAMIAVAEG